eukprot:gene12164-13302_t
MDSIENLFRTVDIKDQLPIVKSLIDEAATANNIAKLTTILNRLLRDDVPPQNAKASVLHFAQSVTKHVTEDNLEELGNLTLDALKPFSNQYDEADYILRDRLFNLYVSWGQCVNAAQVLSNVNLASTARVFSDTEKVDIYIKCAEAFLEEEAAVDAEVFVNKASAFINNINEWALLLRYRVTFARVLDANRKFVEAALRYYELSTTDTTKIVAEETLELLAKAVTCTILGKTGPQRNRVMGLIYNDPRLLQLDQLGNYTAHSILLTKMYKGFIIRKAELGGFEACLQEHQKASTAEGFTLLEKAIIEHNMIATSNIYLNIKISDLSEILLIDVARTEKVAAQMIAENRLKATIDQVSGYLIFESTTNYLSKLDEEINNICQEVNNFIDIWENEVR